MTCKNNIKVEKSINQNGYDTGSTYRWQHTARLFEPGEEAGRWVARVLEEAWIDRLVVAGYVSEAQRDAAMRLRADYQAARVEDRQIASYQMHYGHSSGYYSHKHELDDAAEGAYYRWRHALKYVGPHTGDLLVTVCCLDRPIPAQKLNALITGLLKLCQHYGLPTT